MKQHLLLENNEFKEKVFPGSLNPPLRKLYQAALNNVSMRQYIVVSLRCILKGRWKIYYWTDTGNGILIYVTPVTYYHALRLWMLYLLKQCGVRVWEASCCSCSSWEWQGGRIDCDSSHCGFAPCLFLPPGSCCSFTLNECTPQRLYSCSLGGRTKEKLRVGAEKPLPFFFLPCVVSLVYRHNGRQMMLTEAGGWWDTPLVHPFFEQRKAIGWVPMQLWFPGLGDRKWD